jgi:membrane peptidoglycan carboxypeptidase
LRVSQTGETAIVPRDDHEPAGPAWRRWVPGWKSVVVSASLLTAAVAGVLGIAYAETRIPAADALAGAQASRFYFSDGHTLFGRTGSVYRISVPLSTVPRTVQDAVLAAEDRNFYSEPGISVSGIVRAAWNDLTGGSLQGGSTITQQYAKNAYLTDERTVTRKVREILLALKLAQTYSKQQILQDYLNTIYFGRGAYGIQAAAYAFFGRSVARLSLAQGAVLAAAIDAPSYYDPSLHPQAARARWRYVLDGLVTTGNLSSAQAAQLRYPRTVPPRQLRSTTGLSGPDGFIMATVIEELRHHGFTESQLNLGGYRVITTINRRMQRSAVAAENQVLPASYGGEPVSALVAVQPGTGAVRAMYGGRDYGNRRLPASFLNLAMDVRRQAGSSFKPYTLITALRRGIGLNSFFNGSSPKFVKGYGASQLVYNDSNEQCPQCTLLEGLYRSINTVFVPLALRVGPANIRANAYRAGVDRSNSLGGRYPGAGITLGVYGVRVIDQAVGFATIAAQGVRAPAYLVQKVIAPDGTVVYQAHPHPVRVFPAPVMADTTYAMQQVLDNPAGTAYGNQLAGRPAAGKTGTTTSNRDAWFIGFTPQLCTAVWMGNANDAPLTNVPGYAGGVYGGTLPARIWQHFMDAALAGYPVRNFPPPAHVGRQLFSPPPTVVPVAPSSFSPPPTVTPFSVSPTPTRTQSPLPPPPTSPPPTPSVSPTPPASPANRAGAAKSAPG